MASFRQGTSLLETFTFFNIPILRLGIFLALSQIVLAELLVRIDEITFTLGQNVTIKWEGGKEPVSIQLFIKREDGRFDNLSDITTNQKGDGQFEWKTPKDLKPGTYGIVVTDSPDRIATTLPFDVQEDTKIVSVQPFNAASVNRPTASVPSQTTLPTEPLSDDSFHDGLNTSAKAGIGIGVGVSGITMIILATTCVHRRRDRNLDEEEFLCNSHHFHSPRSMSPKSLRPGASIISPVVPSPPPRTPNRGLQFHFPRSLTPKLGMSFSLNLLLSPSTLKSPKAWWTERPPSPLPAEKESRAHIVGPPTELPGRDMDVEVPYRHEMPTEANTPELPGSPEGTFSARGRKM